MKDLPDYGRGVPGGVVQIPKENDEGMEAET
jgi:hypothetical protein